MSSTVHGDLDRALINRWQLCAGSPFENTDFLIDIPAEEKQWKLRELPSRACAIGNSSERNAVKGNRKGHPPPYLPTSCRCNGENSHNSEKKAMVRSAQNMKQQSEKLRDTDTIMCFSTSEFE